ncbi:hypothetical protein TNCV_1176901 [Trichonephila clavipes]|nr:hypothetical protein TNCV_1176901 [Trichonephila clavipes]
MRRRRLCRAVRLLVAYDSLRDLVASKTRYRNPCCRVDSVETNDVTCHTAGLLVGGERPQTVQDNEMERLIENWSHLEVRAVIRFLWAKNVCMGNEQTCSEMVSLFSISISFLMCCDIPRQCWQRHPPRPGSMYWDLIPTKTENLFPLICPILKCLAPSQASTAVGYRNQRLVGGSTTIETKQKLFLADDIYLNFSAGCLLELLEYVGHRLGVVFANFFGQNCSVSIS